MVHHAPSGRNEVGQAFLPVLDGVVALLVRKEEIFHFSFLISHFSFQARCDEACALLVGIEESLLTGEPHDK